MNAPKIETNKELREINRRISRLEDELNQAYQARAGRVMWAEGHDENGCLNVAEAWCCCCGRNQVNPNDGQDTCHVCTKNI